MSTDSNRDGKPKVRRGRGRDRGRGGQPPGKGGGGGGGEPTGSASASGVSGSVSGVGTSGGDPPESGSGVQGTTTVIGTGLRRRVFDATSTTERTEVRGAGNRTARAGRNKRRGGRRGRSQLPGAPPPVAVRGVAEPGGAAGAAAASTPGGDDAAAFGQTWWGKRWLQAVEGVSTAYANRLPRGLSYAQSGRVKNLKVTPGRVEAQVSGRRAAPYKVGIQLRQLTNAQWKKIIEMLANRAAFTASLLAGEMPERITDVFEQCGLSLFPQRNRDIKASCNCPDWANPCKHIAATHYVIGEALDSDPFLLLTLRGRSREDVLVALRAARSGEDVDDEPIGGPGKEHLGISVGQLDAASFFASGDDLDEFRFHIAQPEIEMPVLRRLGPPPSWSLGVSLLDLLEPIYHHASLEAEKLGLRELGPRPPLPPELLEEEVEEDDDELDERDEGRRALSAGNVPLGDEHGEGEEADGRPGEGPTVLVRRRAAEARPANGARRNGRERRRRDRRDDDAPGELEAGPETVASPNGQHPAPADALAEVEQGGEGAQPRLSRRVVPGTTETGQAPSLEDRLEMILPITESMPEGPQIARQIIWALKTHGPATARQLARRTRMKKTAVLQLLQSLLAVGLVVQDGQGDRARFMAPDT